MGRRTKETEADSKEKDVEMSAAEKLHIANFYADHCEAIEGKLEGASKNAKESRRDKAYSQLAAELTAMGVAVRTEGRVKKKLSDMKQKAKNKISKEVSGAILVCYVRFEFIAIVTIDFTSNL
jgi:hypothetical protein